MNEAAGDNPRVLFICRGSAADGLGHVIRTRTVAEAVGRWAAVRIAVIGDAVVEPLLAGCGLPWEVAADDAVASRAADAFRPDIAVFDTLRLDQGVFQRLAAGRTTVSLCPIFDRQAEVDLVFHRTRALGEMDPPGWRGELRAGLRYSVVRPGVTRIPTPSYEANLAQERLAVAVSMGGGDAGNKTLRVLEALRDVSRPLLLWVLLGEGYGHSYEALVRCARASVQHEVILAKTNESMWRVLGACSVAILAGGTTTYEAAAAALPSINLFEAAGQTFLVEELVERGACLSAGAPAAPAMRNAARALVELERDRGRLLRMHHACADLVDLRGAERIAGEVLAFHRQRRSPRAAG